VQRLRLVPGIGTNWLQLLALTAMPSLPMSEKLGLDPDRALRAPAGGVTVICPVRVSMVSANARPEKSGVVPGWVALSPPLQAASPSATQTSPMVEME
jgi:hypothetical protein